MIDNIMKRIDGLSDDVFYGTMLVLWSAGGILAGMVLCGACW